MNNRLTQFEFLGVSSNRRERGSTIAQATESTRPPTRNPDQVASSERSLRDRQHPVREEFSWRDYRVDARVKLDVWLLKAVRQDGTDRVVAIRAFPKEGSDRIYQRYEQLKHQHLVNSSEIFFTNNPQEYMCVVSEYLPFSLDHLAACETRPSDRQLASMIGQILGALDYLHSAGLVHGSLKCSSALITYDGVIKIADFRDAQIGHGKMNESTDIKAAGHIMMELMHGKSEPDGIIGVRDSHRGADVMEFLAAIDLGLAANRLLTYSFLAFGDGTAKWTSEHLQNFVINATYWSQVNYIRSQPE